MASIILLLLACKGDMVIASPSDGVRLSAGWAPVVVRVPKSHERAEFELELDGRPWSDPVAVVHERTHGRGYEYVATLRTDTLAPGPHTLEVRTRKGGRRLSRTSRFTVEPPPHEVVIHVDDGAGNAIPARIVVHDADGPVPLGTPDADERHTWYLDAALSSVFAPRGTATVRLNPGPHRLYVVQDLRRDVAVIDTDIDGDAVHEVSLPRVVDTEGLLTADLHVHTAASYDSVTPHQLRFESLAAAGLDVVVLTDHDVAMDPSGPVKLVGAGFDAVRGVEADVRVRDEPNPDLGHINVFPVAADVEDMPDDHPAKLGAYLHELRNWARPSGPVVLQLNHPRGIHFADQEVVNRGAWALFNALGFDNEAPVSEHDWMVAPSPGFPTTAMDFDTLEVMNRSSVPLYRKVRADWFALCNQGICPTGTGNSDSHGLALELAGMPLNLVRAEVGDRAGFLAALKDGHVTATTGPIVDLQVDGQTAQVRVQAAPWIPLREVRLVVNGEVVHTRRMVRYPEPGGVSADETFRFALDLSVDSWVLAEAGWPLDGEGGPAGDSAYAAIAPGYVPMAFTNPVHIDVDGDGDWTPPGL